MGNLDAVLNDINKKFGGELVIRGTDLKTFETIPFSSPRANYITYGGVPRGKATEFFGPENGGKTTSCLDIVGQAQVLAEQEWEEKMTALKDECGKLRASTQKASAKKLKEVEESIKALEKEGPQKVVYVDAENTLDVDWAKLNGVVTEDLILIRPEEQTAEEVTQMILDVIDSGGAIAVVLDSVPALIPKALYEKDMEGKSYGGVAGVMTLFSGKAAGKLSKTNTTLLVVNQVREDLANPYNIYKTPGGKALKHLYMLRLYVNKGTLLDEKGGELKKSAAEPVAHQVDMKIVKTKCCKPDRLVGYYTLNYEVGVDILADTIDVAQWYGLISKSGSWFTLMSPEGTGEILEDEDGEILKFQGSKAVLEYLRNDDDLFNEYWEALQELMKNN